MLASLRSINPTVTIMTRNGKIARLPRHVREELNRRLDNGEPGVGLVEWLNNHPDAQRMLTRHFDGRPVNEQNLTEWKHGGFLDWQRHQESCEWVRSLADEADHLTEVSGVMPLSDRLSSVVALTLGRVLRDLNPGSLTDASSRADFVQLLKELARLRREDRESVRLRNYLEMPGGPGSRRRRFEIDDDDDDDDLDRD
jgi:hypothetical protein